MKNIKIKLLLITLLVITVVGVSYFKVNYTRSAFLFSSNSDSNVEGGFKKSEFIKFNGNDYYTINIKDTDTLYYNYSLELESGEITIILIDNNRVIWSSDKLISGDENSGGIKLQGGKNTKLRVIGKNATGNYHFQWYKNLKV